jgi:glucokinase
MTTTTIGVDVGGTKVAAATLTGTTLGQSAREPTELASTERLLGQLVRMIGEQGSADAVGLGLPSAIDAATGTVRDSVNIPLQNVPIRDELEQRLGLPVVVANDAQAAGLSEAYDDDFNLVAGSLILLTVGTGVGGAIIIGGEIYLGATGAAGHLGHQVIAAQFTGGEPEHSSSAPQPGTLEALAAGRVLDAMARERGYANGPAAVTAALGGDDQALDAVRLLGIRLGLGIANVINIFDPNEVVIGGGVSAAGDLLLQPARRTAEQFTLSGLGTATTIRLARYGQAAGVRGAALLAIRSLNKG